MDSCILKRPKQERDWKSDYVRAQGTPSSDSIYFLQGRNSVSDFETTDYLLEVTTWSSGLVISNEKFLFSSLVSRATASSRFCTSIPLIYKEKGGGVDGSMIRLCKTIPTVSSLHPLPKHRWNRELPGRLKRRLIFKRKGLVQSDALSLL